MAKGLYGKLHAKRDFVAIGIPRGFLSCWEPWLQGAISASRDDLGQAWQDAFLTSPIWRFWLGSSLCGSPVLGAIMPSVDGVGRCFPLTVVAHTGADGADAGVIPPPEIEPQEPWFDAAEDFLFSTLEPERPFETIAAALDGLPAPLLHHPDLAHSDGPLRGGAAMAAAEGEAGFRAAFTALRLGDFDRFHGDRSFWWTAGGEGYQRRAASFAGMPSPYFLSALLTGKFRTAPLTW